MVSTFSPKQCQASKNKFSNLDKYISVGFKQSYSVDKRDLELGAGIEIYQQHILEGNIGLSSGFLIGKEHTTPNLGADLIKRTAGFPSDVVLGLGNNFGINYQYEFSKSHQSCFFNSVAFSHQRFRGLRNPKDLYFDNFGISVDEFNADVNVLSVGLGYKKKMSELFDLSVSLNWDIHSVDYFALGYKFGTTQSHNAIIPPMQIPFKERSIRNMFSLRVAVNI